MTERQRQLIPVILIERDTILPYWTAVSEGELDMRIAEMDARGAEIIEVGGTLEQAAERVADIHRTLFSMGFHFPLHEEGWGDGG